MENLDKEMFWTPLMKECPKVVDNFCNWIDEYKKRVKWDELFHNYSPAHVEGSDASEGDEEMHMVKFHDIPYEMQHGIFNAILCRML